MKIENLIAAAAVNKKREKLLAALEKAPAINKASSGYLYYDGHNAQDITKFWYESGLPGDDSEEFAAMLRAWLVQKIQAELEICSRELIALGVEL